jgi:predicted DNA binding protein
MWETELAIRHRGCPVSDVSSDHPGVRFENVKRVRAEDGRAKRLLSFQGDQSDIDAFVEDFRAHPATGELEALSREEGPPPSTYYIGEIYYVDGNPSIRHLVERAGLFRHPKVVVCQGIEHWRVYTRHKGAVRRFVDTVESYDNDVDVIRNVDIGTLTENAGEQAPLRSELTERQAQTFQAALSLGYYEGESRVTIEDIADHLGVHRSTAGEHVKRAENALLSAVGSRLFPESTPEQRVIKH